MTQLIVTLPQFIAHYREADEVSQSLEAHLQGVGKKSAKNASKLKLSADADGCQINLEAVGEILGLLHDLGKYSKSFQDYLRSGTGLIDEDADDYVNATQLRGRIDHSTAGAQFIWQKLSSGSTHNLLCAQVMALCIASHHSGLIDCISPEGIDNFTKRMNKPDELVHLNEVLVQVDESVKTRLFDLIHDSGFADNFQKIIQNMTGMERVNNSNKVLHVQLGLLTRFLFSCLIDADRVDTADFVQPHARHFRNDGIRPNWPQFIALLENHLSRFADVTPIDELRRQISTHCRNAAERHQGIFTLTVPTGGGKTLASLRFALHHAQKYGLDRVIYVTPFTSIIDQNADVVRAILEPASEGIEPGSVVLEHHSNLTPDEQTWRAKILSENWDAPVVFTTSVQFLETLFGAGTRGARRMHQLANSVIIFDEAQTIPVRCVHLFNNAINFLVGHCASSVVLCTATQPLLNKVDSQKGAARFGAEDEIISDISRLFVLLKRVDIINRYKPGGWNDDEVASLAQEEIEHAGSCLIIVNTRKAAQTLFNICVQRMRANHHAVYHLSTSMCPEHRRHILAKIRADLTNGVPILCISTQLIEAGVDVDFGAVIRHVAGLDSIAQAAGRCNRNGRREIGRVHVINPAEERIDKLIDICIGRDVTMKLLAEYDQNPALFDHDLIGPKAMSAYFMHYFYQRADDMDYPTKEAMRDDNVLNLFGENNLAVNDYKTQNKKSPPIHLRHAFMSAAREFKAIDAPTKGVIVPYDGEGSDLINQLCAEFKPELRFDLLRRAQQFSVNVFPQVFDALVRKGAISEIGKDIGVFYLRPEYYSKQFGLCEEPAVPMETLYV